MSLEAPPPPLEQLQWVFALAGRSFGAMIVANERAQLESLSERDVAVIVPTGDIGSGQFPRVAETLPLGAASARGVADLLSRYTVPEEDYRAWRANLDRPEAGLLRVEGIRFQALRHASEDFLKTRLRTRPGQAVSLAAVEGVASRAMPCHGEGGTLLMSAGYWSASANCGLPLVDFMPAYP